MIDYITRKIRRHKEKRTFKEYGYEIKSFNLSKDGEIYYAQWLHPSESTKKISQEDIDSVRKFVKEGDLVIDIGAHTGDTTIPMAIASGKNGCILALEPNPLYIKFLKEILN
jgi:hypothetical protein